MYYCRLAGSGAAGYDKNALSQGLSHRLPLLFRKGYARPVLSLVYFPFYLLHIHIFGAKRKFQQLFCRRYFRIVHRHKIYGVYAVHGLVYYLVDYLHLSQTVVGRFLIHRKQLRRRLKQFVPWHKDVAFGQRIIEYIFHTGLYSVRRILWYAHGRGYPVGCLKAYAVYFLRRPVWVFF